MFATKKICAKKILKIAICLEMIYFKIPCTIYSCRINFIIVWMSYFHSKSFENWKRGKELYTKHKVVGYMQITIEWFTCDGQAHTTPTQINGTIRHVWKIIKWCLYYTTALEYRSQNTETKKTHANGYVHKSYFYFGRCKSTPWEIPRWTIIGP